MGGSRASRRAPRANPPAMTMSSAAPLLQAAGLTKRLRSGSRDLTILDGVDLSVDAGEFVCIVGPSGSGKSTLLGLLAGLDRPTAGDVTIDGASLAAMDEDELALRAAAAWASSSSPSSCWATSRRARTSCSPWNSRASRTPPPGRRAPRSGGPADRGHHYPSQLGREQQRVALARAFGPRPALLFADEPTGNLDSETGARVLEMLLELRRDEGTALILVTHDLEIAARAPCAVHVRGGRTSRRSTGAGTPRRDERGRALRPLTALMAASPAVRGRLAFMTAPRDRRGGRHRRRRARLGGGGRRAAGRAPCSRRTSWSSRAVRSPRRSRRSSRPERAWSGGRR